MRSQLFIADDSICIAIKIVFELNRFRGMNGTRTGMSQPGNDFKIQSSKLYFMKRIVLFALNDIRNLQEKILQSVSIKKPLPGEAILLQKYQGKRTFQIDKNFLPRIL